MVSDESPVDSRKVRIVNIYSTGYVYNGVQEQPLGEKLLQGALSEYYDLYRVQLPRLLPEDFLTAAGGTLTVSLRQQVSGMANMATDAMLFALPSNQVVVAIQIAFDCDLHRLEPIVGALEQGVRAGILLNGESLEDALRSRLSRVPDMTIDGGPGADAGRALLPERHQLVFIRRDTDTEEVPSAEDVQRIVFRETPPLTEEFALPKAPIQLNQVRAVQSSSESRADPVTWRQLLRREEPVRLAQEPEYRQITLGVVTPYVSLLFGHRPYIEGSVLLSSVHAVGTASKFRQIWSDTYEQVRLFRRNKQEQETGRQTRASFEELADRLGNLEFDLTFSVEFPQLRIESFQKALYEAMDLTVQARTLSDMFTQVANSVRSEITAITVREQQISEGRHRWNAFAGGILSLFGVSIGFVVAFLGINTNQVPSGDVNEVSMWSPHFADVYLIAGLFAVVPVFFIVFPYLREWAGKKGSRRALWAGAGGVASGLVLFLGAVVTDDILGGQGVVSALVKAVAVLLFTVGLSLAGLYLSAWLKGKRRRALRVFSPALPVAVLSGLLAWYSWSDATAGRLVTVVAAAVSAIATVAAAIAAVRAIWHRGAGSKPRPGRPVLGGGPVPD